MTYKRAYPYKVTTNTELKLRGVNECTYGLHRTYSYYRNSHFVGRRWSFAKKEGFDKFVEDFKQYIGPRQHRFEVLEPYLERIGN